MTDGAADVDRDGPGAQIGGACGAILRRFGGNMKACRVAARLTQSMRSERCFLSCQQISRLERGKLAPNLLVLLMLSDTLGTSLDELTEGVDSPTRRPSCILVRQLIERSPGVRTGEIADSLDLPFWHVRRDARRMFSLGEIRGRSSSWQPALGPRVHGAEQR
jgi:transcriptional regulator with XRE-family HTH domain